MKKRKPIKIKKKNRGKFTASAKRKGRSLSEHIRKGKKSKNPLTRKRAVFAANMRKIARKRKKKKK